MTARSWLLLRSGALAAAFVAGAVVAAIAGSALVVYLPYAAVGTLLISRRPRNVIGWLLLPVAWGFAVGWLPVEATAQELATGAAPVIVLLVAWSKWWWGLPVILSLIATIALVFPSGRLPAGRWRTPARLMLAFLALFDIASAAWPVIEVVPGGGGASFRMPNPLWPAGIQVPGDLAAPTSGGLIVFALLLVAVASLFVRYRRAHGLERSQLGWLVAALAAIGLAIPAGFSLLALGAGELAWVPATLSFALPPVAIGVAVLRYRLYELDRIISRTIGWAGITAVLAAIYLAGLLILQAALGGFTQGNTLAVAGSTLLAAAAFQPLRRRIQVAVDHRFDRARYDGERIAAAFGDRLRGQINLDGLRADMGATVAVALRPSTSELWIRPTGSAGEGP
jgi:hypothetical protein